MAHEEEDLKKAILIIHLYHRYDATPLKAEVHEDEVELHDDYDINNLDENY